MDLTNIIVMFLITFFATVIFTWFVRKTLRDADLSDNPIVSEHRHKAGTPTMGGRNSFLICYFAYSFIILQKHKFIDHFIYHAYWWSNGIA